MVATYVYVCLAFFEGFEGFEALREALILAQGFGFRSPSSGHRSPGGYAYTPNSVLAKAQDARSPLRIAFRALMKNV